MFYVPESIIYSVPAVYGGSYVCLYVTMWFRRCGFTEQCLKLDIGVGVCWWGWPSSYRERPKVHNQSVQTKRKHFWEMSKVSSASYVQTGCNRIYIMWTPISSSPSTSAICFERRCLKILIKNSICGRHTDSAAVEIHFKWVVSRESTAITQIQPY